MTQRRDTEIGFQIERIGLVVGVIAFVTTMIAPAPAGLSEPAWVVAGLSMLMAIWWVTEALPLAVTALVPIALLPALRIQPFESVAQSYAHPLIFLFLGGFLIARAMERWRLHEFVAIRLVRVGGDGPAAQVGGLMAATAFLSMWISNTAAAMVMLPIGQSVIAQRRARQNRGSETGTVFGPAVMLGIAYAATIGGVATLIGTPPNALFAAYLAESHGISIGFSQWMGIGLPITLVLLPLAWLILTRFVFSVPFKDDASVLKTSATVARCLSRPEKIVASIIVAAALCLIFRPLLQRLMPGIILSDAGIFVTAALVLFAVSVPDPSRANGRTALLRWKDAARIRWDVLILFGGGLALASAIADSGLAEWIGTGIEDLGTLPVVLIVLTAMALIVLLGELASNTAMAAVFLPIAGAAAANFGYSLTSIVLPIALAASLGFMLPVATPPNAIVFGSGQVTIRQMLSAGAVLDVVSIALVYAIATLLGPIFLN